MTPRTFFLAVFAMTSIFATIIGAGFGLLWWALAFYIVALGSLEYARRCRYNGWLTEEGGRLWRKLKDESRELILPQMYLNGKPVDPPDGYYVQVETTIDRSHVYLVRPVISDLGTQTGVERFSIHLPIGAKLEIRQGDYLCAAFVERHGIAVDPIETFKYITIQ